MAGNRTGFEEITPEMLQALAEYGIIPDMQTMNMQALAQAQKLRDQPIPTAKQAGTNRWGTYTRQPTALEGIDSALKSVTGAMDENEAKASIMANMLRQRDIYAQGMAGEQDSRKANYDASQKEFADKAAYDAAGVDQMRPFIDANAQSIDNQWQERGLDQLTGGTPVRDPVQQAIATPQPPGAGRGNINPPLAIQSPLIGWARAKKGFRR